MRSGFSCWACIAMSENECTTCVTMLAINLPQIRHVSNEFLTNVLHIRLINSSPRTYNELHFSLSPCTYVGTKSCQCLHIMSEGVDDVKLCINICFLGSQVNHLCWKNAESRGSRKERQEETESNVSTIQQQDKKSEQQ